MSPSVCKTATGRKQISHAKASFDVHLSFRESRTLQLARPVPQLGVVAAELAHKQSKRRE